MGHTLCDTILTVLLSPVGLYCKSKKCDNTLILNILLFIFGLDVLGIIHAFMVYGLDLICSLLCLFIPPLAVCLYHGGAKETIVSILLWILGVLPGVIYAYHVCLEKHGGSEYKPL